MKSLALKISLLTTLPLLTTSTFAAQMNYIVQAQLGANATHVPTLSGTMLVLLSLVLFAVAFKYAKQKTGANKLFISLIGVIALSAGGGGLKLVSDAQAVIIKQSLNGTVGVEANIQLTPGVNYFSNEINGKTIKILSFNYIVPEQGTLSCVVHFIAQKCTVNLILKDPANSPTAETECALSCTLSSNGGGDETNIQ